MEHYLGPTRSLTVVGSAFERARQQGVLCAPEMDRAASSIGSLVLDPSRLRVVGAELLHQRASALGLSVAGAYYLLRHRPALVAHERAKYWHAQRGLAEGAGKSVPAMFGLGAVPEIVGARMGYTLGCTAVALSAAVTEHGAPQIAYNHDFPPRFGRYSFVRRNHASDGFASVSLSYPIMVGSLAGVNERGLAVTLNHAFSVDGDGSPGLLLTTLVQDALDRCATVAEAVALFERAPVTNGAILTLADESGERAVVERSCTSSRVRRTDASALVSFNKYRHPEMEAFEVPLGAVSTGLLPGIPLHASNVERQRRWDEIAGERLDGTNRRLEEDDVRTLMRDHRGGRGDSNTICRHDDPLSETLWGALIDTRKRTVRVVFGHACDGDYVAYGIAAAPALA